jgi:SpoVK/Ycf46/Vps4 family AAA+-type ATPase
LLELCREAAYEPVREKTTEEILKIDKFRPIVFKDFEKAMNVIRGTISPEANTEMDKWNETFGTL